MWVALKGPADFRIFQYYWNKQRLHVVRRPNTTRSNPHIWETKREFLACLQFDEIELGKKNPTSLNLTPPAWNDFLFSGKIQCFKALCHFLDAGDVVFSASDLYMKCFYLSKSKNNEIIQTNKKKKQNDAKLNLKWYITDSSQIGCDRGHRLFPHSLYLKKVLSWSCTVCI